MLTSELIKERERHSDRARFLNDRAEQEARDLNQAERAEFDKSIGEVERFSRAIDRETQLGELNSGLRLTPTPDPISSNGESTRSTSGWQDHRGNPVTVLAPQQRCADLYRHKRAVTSSGEPLSVGRLVAALITGNWDNARGEQRTMQTEGVAYLGGYTVPDVLSAEMVDLVRARSVIFQAGARTIPMEYGDQMKIVRVANDPTLEVKSEGVAFTGSNITFDRLSFVPLTIGTTIQLSRELIEDSINVSTAIEDVLSRSLATELDYQILYGRIPGILGLGLDESINEVDSVGTPGDWSKWLNGVKLVLEDNFEPNALVLAPRDHINLESLQESTTDQYLGPPPSIAKLRRFVTTALPTTLGAGAESLSILGDFTRMIVVVRQQAQIEVSKDEGDSFAKHAVSVKITMRADAHPERGGAFCRLNGITSA